jgi:hypothetical protein
MKALNTCLAAALFLSGCAVAVVGPGRHPAYLHALSNLRAARWALQHRLGDAEVGDDEAGAISEINAAINGIKQAAYDDDKNPNGFRRPNMVLDYRGRLHRALDLLNDAHRDLDQEEDNTAVMGIRDDAVGHVDQAAEMVKKALFDAHFE